MDMNQFEKIIEEAFNRIPRKFKKILEKENIRLLPRESVPAAVKDKFKNSIVFGVFIGVPHNKRSIFNIQSEPTRIELYKESFVMAFTEQEEMETQIIKTVIHEIGHYFGFSEDELRNYLV
ncbi:MAG: hypothetical protein A2474_04810 [Elusimicrobia bacterium RIFOXYC2_FULL_34_12]|nr:MAG: hypothetical protein A2474_04810 [Elusimicrobia bacterium RIFOXYC2_FULL_34_12]OGS39179.1 MAG: hypothetical protein A2551_05515 [Elusimicrobia bacterium RIFOXYD2_FULL_34_30]HAM38049.1 hypothetical protein [Elusimicrobiota bacterium]